MTKIKLPKKHPKLTLPTNQLTITPSLVPSSQTSLNTSTEGSDFERRLRLYLHKKNNSEVITALRKRRFDRFDSPEFWRYGEQGSRGRGNRVSIGEQADRRRMEALPCIADIRVTRLEARERT
jgi:hypothetical protein